MNSADVLAALTILTGLVSSIGVVIVNIIVARQGGKIDLVDRKADVITGHVNSAAATSAAKIDALEKQVASLISQLSEKKETAALLAQSVAEKRS